MFAGIAVFEGNQTFNISHEFSCFLGYSPNKHLPQADLGLLVDVDVPWFPADVTPNPKAFWAHIDVDTLKAASPMWTFPGNLRMQGDSGRILGQLLEEMKKKATPKFKEAAQKRVAALTEERKAWRHNAAKLASNKGKPGEINPHYVFAELNKVLKEDDIVLNEGVRNAGACLLQLARPLPNTCVRSGGGGLGWSGGMALGCKLAAPDKTVVQVVGDGGFYFGGPSSVFSVARQYKLPIFVLLLDNAGWSAVKESTLRVFPDGEAKTADRFQAHLMPDAEFSKIGEAFGAYGEKVTNPDDVPAAIARCIKEVRGGRAAVLHARVTKL
jgi:acetolactate synthase-1/2/3 large subunit